jgi:hypothetical protein
MGDNADNVLIGTPGFDEFFPRGGRDLLTGNGGDNIYHFGSQLELAEAERGIFDRITDFTFQPGDSSFAQDTLELTGVFAPHFLGTNPDLTRSVRILEDPSGGFSSVLVDKNAQYGGSDWVRLVRLDDVEVGETVRVEVHVDHIQSRLITVGEWVFGWDILATNDFNGDGRDDLLWRHDSGETLIWHMNGAQHDTQSLGVIDNSWKIAASGDFGGDEKADILWRHENGEILLNGTSLGVNDNAWQVESAADFNGDGTDEIVWRHTGSGEVLLNGQSLGIIDLAWQIAGTGDFDGDGNAELLWEHENGQVLLNGTSLGNIAGQFSIEDIADFNGDARSDIVWRDDRDQDEVQGQPGEARIWYMNGTQAEQVSLGVVDVDWEVEGAGDFDGKADAEIVWRHENGDMLLDSNGVGNVPPPLWDEYLI